MIKQKTGVGKTDIHIEANRKSIVITPNIPTRTINNINMNNQDLENRNIIDFIVAEQQKKKVELNAIREANKTVIDNQTFFIENFEFGIATKADFLAFIDDSKSALKEFQGFIQVMAENRKINHSLPWASKDGNEYYSLKVQAPNGELSLRIKSLDWTDKLLHGYTFNQYSVNMDLQGLYEEANRLAN